MNYPELKKGSTGIAVVELQTLLSRAGFNCTADGFFGSYTEHQVAQFQVRFNLSPDGVVNTHTWKALVNQNYQKSPEIEGAIWLPLPPKEYYYQEETKKKGVTWHHTVSDGNPENVINSWANDDRGRVATTFIIGREMVGGSFLHDGKIYQCMPLDFFAHHLGMEFSRNRQLNMQNIGIEICSAGYLELKDGKYWSSGLKRFIPASQVIEVDFRGKKYWHSYTEGQLKALRQLMAILKNLYGFDYTKALPAKSEFFNLDWNAWSGDRVLTTHTNFRYDKTDCYPHPGLLEIVDDVYSGKL